jgi:iodotyrosine deiodinase
MDTAPMVPLTTYQEYPPEEMARRAADFLAEMQRRRTVRHFSTRPVPRQVISDCIAAAGTAPNGANKQPWFFVAVSSPYLKHQIRLAAEAVEDEFYHGRAPETWLQDLEPFATNEFKPYLDTAPWLIAIFEKKYELSQEGGLAKHYYTRESVGIATGLLITALHHAGLVTLTHTPSPMDFLNQVLGRPSSERAYLLLVVGYPEENVQVPDITRKPLNEIAAFIE